MTKTKHYVYNDLQTAGTVEKPVCPRNCNASYIQKFKLYYGMKNQLPALSMANIVIDLSM